MGTRGAPAAGRFGMGVVLAPFFSIALAGVSDREVGSAAGVTNAVQQLGSALGVALLGTVFFATTDGSSLDGSSGDGSSAPRRCRRCAHSGDVPTAPPPGSPPR
ncbi:hypothetical protein [Streptomyces halobius]|uniref:MFS transporter n=1 Tax=Streptomyces halobius TaxID=2879846 RepID=A0ABY4M9D1_9ACTN|nr:hypothetical protein [Streptomyces halobius]UQA93978.1 hypothetical protein K9S39_20735 [Streptomyces halobius]